MELSTVFQVSVYSFVCLASVVLAVAEPTPFPALLTLPVGLMSLFLTERRRVIRLPSFVANLLGMAALGLSGIEFFQGDLFGRLLSGAHLLVYLTWITLFQEKQARQYWWLCALAVLQLAVASIMTTSGTFGMLLVLFLVLGIWTLSVFSLNEARLQYAGTERFAVITNMAEAVGSGAVELRERSVARGSVQHDPNENWITKRFVAGVLLVSLLTMAIGAIFFVLIPRLPRERFENLGLSKLSERGLGGRPLTGFAERIQLGDIGEILESTDPVLKVRVFDLEREAGTESGEISVEEFAREYGQAEPLFKGAVLAHYERGGWEPAARGGYSLNRLSGRAEVARYRQECLLEPIGSTTLFSMGRVLGGRLHEPKGKQILTHRRESILQLGVPEAPSGQVRYELYLAEANWGPNTDSNRGVRSFLTLPPRGLERLVALAEEVGRDEDGQRGSGVDVAHRLEDYLSSSGGFSYTLNASITDPAIDPIEDFLFNRKSGHCEYFASALVLMLRAVEIPARLVSGFKGGDTNQLTGEFVVQQRHAHAWVEAYVDGRWTTFDPTPAQGRAESVESMQGDLQSWNDLTAVMRAFWDSQVMDIDQERQRRSIYGPLGDLLRKGVDGLKDIRGSIGSLARTVRSVIQSPKRWFSVQGGVISFVLLLLLSCLAWLGRFGWEAWKRWRERLKLRETAARRQVAFYERFCRLVSGVGLEREPAQTQQEFAAAAAARLGERLPQRDLADLPRLVARLFYGVRFGAHELNPTEARSIEQRLDELETWLNEPKPG